MAASISILLRKKETLVRETMNEAFDQTNALYEQRARSGEYGLEAIVRGYLTPGRRDRPESGCAAAAPGRHDEIININLDLLVLIIILD